ncbi:tyrosine-protein phosphatase [Nosocomiicoccus ampullae]|uniref:tyrosine-protein phosphatase n=1 Tax=Nosocomiicoccus ampullae TaxID=489910 RepID=UPI001C5F184E|nr:CpsB/CapC family capsule biosynthesis tyrosine phosphatase [Nosocomiicoccus ampullae]QYA48293.1 capsular biosynthesis protein [Nosocomiicoccus ampullae]
MIDIHSHVLVGVDDGPKELQDAIELLKQAKSEGVTDIIVTPHHLHPNWNNKKDNVENGLEYLKNQKEIQELGIKLHPGQEIRIKDELFEELESSQAIGLANTKYILIELPSSNVPSSTKQIIFELQKRGYIPIIAHPERNKAIANDLKLLYELVNNGALAQLTTVSLNGGLGKKLQQVSLQMIEHNLVHFIASDAHNVETRPFIMESLFNNKKLKPYHEEMNHMIKNAELLLKNEKIYINQPEEPTQRKKFLGIF